MIHAFSKLGGQLLALGTADNSEWLSCLLMNEVGAQEMIVFEQAIGEDYPKAERKLARDIHTVSIDMAQTASN